METASKSELRKFGLTVGAAFAVLGLISWWRGHVTPPLVLWSLAVLLVVPGLLVPRALGPVRVAWMRGALALGEFNSRVILTLLFYGILAPVGLVLRRFRDPLDRSMTEKRPTQWIRRERGPIDRARYERQF
jgi:hypothetical protein